MRNPFGRFAILASLASLPGVQPAVAATYIYTVSGTISSVQGLGDYYDSVGSPFTATWTVDTSSPTAVYSYNGSQSSAQGGGMFMDGTTPPVSVGMTFGGNFVNVRQGNSQIPLQYDELDGFPYGPYQLEHDLGSVEKNAAAHELDLTARYSYIHEEYFAGLRSRYNTNDNATFQLFSPAFTSGDFRQTGTFTLGPTSTGDFESDFSYIDHDGSSVDEWDLSLSPTKLTITSASATPEPSAWMMLIAGISLTGSMIRRRRERTAGSRPFYSPMPGLDNFAVAAG